MEKDQYRTKIFAHSLRLERENCAAEEQAVWGGFFGFGFFLCVCGRGLVGWSGFLCVLLACLFAHNHDWLITLTEREKASIRVICLFALHLLYIITSPCPSLSMGVTQIYFWHLYGQGKARPNFQQTNLPQGSYLINVKSFRHQQQPEQKPSSCSSGQKEGGRQCAHSRF